MSADAAVLSSTSDSSSNRYNVVILLDASGSISKEEGTDPEGLRYEAIEQFISLLAVNGNHLGGVVFASEVDAVAEMREITSEADKEEVVDTLSSIFHESGTKDGEDAGGLTNIGAGLSQAVEMLLEDGDPELPSVVVFLSDGNTDFGNISGADEKESVSLELEADALEQAQENDIEIYTVCLNTNQDISDTDEMKRLASATGGEYVELTDADDLSEVFQTFYTLIYGSGIYSAADDAIGDDGTLSTIFTVPGIGVEEINIIIDGEIAGYSVANPDGEAVNATAVYSVERTNTEEAENTATGMSLQMIKVESADVSAGDWTLIVEGDPGNSVKVNLIFNTDLSVTASASIEAESDDGYYTGDTLVVSAVLSSDGVTADTEEQYSGYEATLEIRKADDAYQTVVAEIPMEVEGDHFEAAYEFTEEGTYNYDVYVEYPAASEDSTPYFERTTELADNAIVVGDVPDYQDPVAIEDTVTKTVYVIPFRISTLSVDMASLFEEPTDDITEYNYRIVSSSFIEKDSPDAESGDYYLDGTTIIMDKFSLSKGIYEIQASDWNGDTATVQLKVVTVNVALVTLIIGGIILLIVLIIMGILLKIALSKPFRGDITAQSCVNGVYKGEKRSPRRGRCKLTVFRMDSIGLDYKKCYFQATGDRYIFLVTNKEIIWNNQKTKKVRIQSGAEVVIHPGQGDPRTISIRFDSRVKTGRRSASGRKAPTARPSSASKNNGRRR